MSRLSNPGSEIIVWRPSATDVTTAIFIADASYVVTGVRESHGVASVSGTLAIEKLTGTTAPGSGATMLSGTVDLAGTANTVVVPSLTGTSANLVLAAGDRIGAVLAGTLTSLVGCCVTISLRRV